MGRCSNYIKCCATCDNWAGPRKVDECNSSKVEFADGAKGACYEKVCSYDTDAVGNSSCDKWQKWKAFAKG